MGRVRYTFRYLRGKWVIFDNDVPTDEWFTYAQREEARKRVYELNGWTYKERKK